jgi:hypothetical protein
MAAAQVSGAAALILSAQPSLSAGELKSDILGAVDPLPSLTGRVISGGRLDVASALRAALARPTGSETAATGTPAGTGSQTPGAASAQAAGTASGAGIEVLASTKLPVRGGRAIVKLRCLGPTTCRSTLKILLRLASYSAGGTLEKRLRSIGRATVTVRAGQVKSVGVELSSTARKLLKAAHGELKALLTIFGPGRHRSARVRLLEHHSVAKRSNV